MTLKKHILFVGAFVPKGGKVGGGQQYACQSLIDATKNDSNIQWITLDTTATTNKERGFLQRFLPAFKRLSTFILYLFTRRIDTVLLFTANGFSFVEKGLMAIMANIFRKNVIIAPRTEMVGIEAQQSKWRKVFTRLVLRSTTSVLCQGAAVRDVLQTVYADDKKYIIIPNWIDIDKYVNNRPVYTTQNTPNQPVKILFLGWIDQYWKGVFDLIEAAAAIRKLNFVIEMAGDGVDLEASKALAQKLNISDKINFLGWANNDRKMELLRRADIFVLPSHSEGYPNALIEAMASGLPCVATDVGCISDIIQSKQTGLMVKVNDVTALADALRQFGAIYRL